MERSITVENLEASEKLYTTLVGPELKFTNSPSFVKNEAYNKLWNTPAAEWLWRRLDSGIPLAGSGERACDSDLAPDFAGRFHAETEFVSFRHA